MGRRVGGGGIVGGLLHVPAAGEEQLDAGTWGRRKRVFERG